MNAKLDKLFQKLSNGKMCQVCGKPAQCTHHLVGRSNELLRYDQNNTLFVCLDCHNKIHAGHINDWSYTTNKEYLDEHKNKSFKQFLLENKMTKQEFYESCEIYLKGVINAND